ncbi:MAG TPA: hypothetical protein VNY51_11525 [Candidatus Dormibacteraeota bacterium]|jgi:hypothetical protein|nr:hypothetical protein [Candidatus Dormibacteraeota bacterium]
MSCKRLLLVAMSVLLCAGLAFAQAPQNNNPEADQFRLGPYPRAEFSSQNNRENDSTVRVHIDPHVYWGEKKQSDSGALRFPIGLESPADATCYAIRSYLVVRDSPDSDTTHRDGSTTCVPAARFRVHAAVDHER